MITKNPKLGEFLKQERQRKNFTQVSLSKELGLKNGQYLHNIEKGKCGFPPKKLARLSIILAVPLEQLKHLMIQDYVENLNQEVSRSL